MVANLALILGGATGGIIVALLSKNIKALYFGLAVGFIMFIINILKN